MEMGIYSGTGTLTAQQKVLAAHKVILEQTTDAQGDFARTADGMANSQRILTARLDEAKIVLGQALLPVALSVVNLFNDKFLPVIEKLAASFGGSTGLVQQTKDFINTARNALAPILEALRNAFDRVSVAMEHNKDDIKAVTDLFRTMADFFVKYIVPIIKYQLVQAIEGIGIAFSVVLKIIGPVVSVISSAINGLLKLIDGAIQRINSLIQAYNRISFLPNLPTIRSSAPTPIAPNIQLPFGGGSVGGNSRPSPSVVIPTLPPSATTPPASAAAPSVSRSATSGGLVPSGNAIPSSFDVAAARRGEERGNVIVNVNAPSAIDEEGFTRAVILALNNTDRRTGGGGSQLIL
jgi:hypothetical protein